jgi:hypothetical protein
MLPTKFRLIWPGDFRGEDFFNRPIRNKNCLWVRGFRGEDENVKVNERRMAKAHLAFGKVS